MARNLWSVYKICKSDKSFSNFSFSIYYTFLWLLTEEYLEPSEHHNGAFFFQKYLTVLIKLLTIFAKKGLSQMFNWVENGFWLRAWNIELTLVPSLQIKPKKCSAKKYVRHRLWKYERSWWDSKQSECICWSSRPKGSL